MFCLFLENLVFSTVAIPSILFSTNTSQRCYFISYFVHSVWIVCVGVYVLVNMCVGVWLYVPCVYVVVRGRLFATSTFMLVLWINLKVARLAPQAPLFLRPSHWPKGSNFSTSLAVLIFCLFFFCHPLYVCGR